VRKREGERELLFLYLFLKGMTGALAPFSYIVPNSKAWVGRTQNLTIKQALQGEQRCGREEDCLIKIR
jgi:hypothetical protein